MYDQKEIMNFMTGFFIFIHLLLLLLFPEWTIIEDKSFFFCVHKTEGRTI